MTCGFRASQLARLFDLLFQGPPAASGPSTALLLRKDRQQQQQRPGSADALLHSLALGLVSLSAVEAEEAAPAVADWRLAGASAVPMGRAPVVASCDSEAAARPQGQGRAERGGPGVQACAAARLAAGPSPPGLLQPQGPHLLQPQDLQSYASLGFFVVQEAARFLVASKVSLGLSFRLSVCLCVHLSVCLSVRLSVCPPVRLSVCLCVHLSVCLSVRPSVCLSD